MKDISSLGYRELAEAMPQQVWTARPDGQLDYVNRQVLEYFQRDSEQLLGSGWMDVVHPEDAPAAVETWVRALQSGGLYEVEFRLRRAGDGMFRWHLGRAVPLRDADQRITRWLGTNTDIHDRKQVEYELRAARLAADTANEAKSDFLASMSHEFRTPLSAVIGYSELLEEDVTERGLHDVAADVHKIRRAARNLLELVNDVLDLSKIEAGKSEVALESLSVREMLDDVAVTSQPLVLSNQNRLEVTCPPDVGTITSDPTKVRQCLLNLLSNAAKFTYRGVIQVSVLRVERMVSFRVADTGSGMTREQMAKLFEPFSQVHNGRQIGGTGLGLVITKRLACILGGDVSLTSEPGQGTVFTLSIRDDAGF